MGASLRPFIRKVATKAAADATAGTKASHLADWTFLATEDFIWSKVKIDFNDI